MGLYTRYVLEIDLINGRLFRVHKLIDFGLKLSAPDELIIVGMTYLYHILEPSVFLECSIRTCIYRPASPPSSQ
jgi:hypothetical protein